jgi:5-methylcytosine-specific restriction endonuclease McrA
VNASVLPRKIETLPEQLRRASNEELEHGLELATRGERSMFIRALHHLNEMERRERHLDLGYSSLFDYCVRKLKHSPAESGRRIQAARCIRRFPPMEWLLHERELSPSAVSLLEPILTESNYEEVISRVRGKSYRTIEEVVSEYRPAVSFRDRLQPVKVAVQPALNVESALLDRWCEQSSPGAWDARHGTQQKLYVQFLAETEFLDLFEEVRSLLCRDGKEKSFADVVMVALKEYRERHSPAARVARREARNSLHPPDAQVRGVCDKSGVNSPDSQRWECSGHDEPRSRHIPADVADEVFVRDGGRCAYVGRRGVRCHSRHGLQIDHIHPFATGGSNNLSNLRLLCAAHNRRIARRQLGERTHRHGRSRE